MKKWDKNDSTLLNLRRSQLIAEIGMFDKCKIHFLKNLSLAFLGIWLFLS